MPYPVEFTQRAERELAALHKPDQLRIAKRIDQLAASPRPKGCKKLAGPEGFYRVRVGDFRLIYGVQDRKLLVLVIRIGNRRDVYR